MIAYLGLGAGSIYRLRQLLANTLTDETKETSYTARTYQIMDLALKVQMAVAYANGIRVETHGLMVERYNAQSMAWSWVYTMDAIVSAMQHDLEADADKLDTLAGLLNQARKTIRAWQQADLKRYEPQFGSLTAAELGEPSTVKLRWF